MTATEMQALVNKTLEMAQVDYKIPITVNARLSRTLGRFSYRANKSRTFVEPIDIEISAQAIKHLDEENLKQVILHECAHAIVLYRYKKETHVHDWAFRMVCHEIHCTHDTPQADVTLETHNKYDIMCPKCGLIGGVSKICKVVKTPQRFSCRNCGSQGLSVIKNW